MPSSRLLFTFALLAARGFSLAADDRAGIAFFEAKVRPLLAERCYECHSSEKGQSKGGLTLDTRAGWAMGGDSRAAIVPGKVEESLLIKAVRYTDADLAMPPKKKGGKLPAADLATLEQWLAMGAPDPREGAAKKLTGLTAEAPELRQSAFLPSLYQGAKTEFKANTPVNKVLSNLRSEFSSLDQQRAQLDLVRGLNERHMKAVQRDEQLEARIESFELAFQMQTAATDAFDISKEPKAVRAAYGKGELAAKLLRARRLVDRGVRFVQVEAGGWDHHSSLVAGITKTSQAVDQPAAALIADLKQKGLLDETLIIWGGEFGRPPNTAGRINDASGRDHWSKVYCCWMAGGGVKAGTSYGESDELGAEPAKDPVHLHDLHATILRLLGFDHTQLTYRYNGRDFRLTDNYGQIVTGITG